ncbi:trypsin-like peptidase domain-containing protein [Luteococcus peritonei]|uniref:S1C family serine protease n=1 Tax=Luteococcus peritonei TaxID=88874 RepID=UPI00360FAC28
MSQQHDPHRPAPQQPDQDWFWARPETDGPTHDEPTGVLPGEESTQVLSDPSTRPGGEPTQVLPQAAWPEGEETTRQFATIEQTQQIPTVEQTQQIPTVEQTRQFPELGLQPGVPQPGAQHLGMQQNSLSGGQAGQGSQDWSAPEAPPGAPVAYAAPIQPGPASGEPGTPTQPGPASGEPGTPTQPGPASGEPGTPVAAGQGGGAVPPGWQPPSGQPWGAPQPQPRQDKPRGRGLLALVAVGAVASLALTQAPGLLQNSSGQAQPGASQSQDPNQLDPRHPAGEQSDQTQTSPTDGSGSSEGPTTSDEQGSDQQQGAEGMPAEQNPFDPWGQGQSGQGQSGQGQSGTGTTQSSQQTTATAEQSVGVVLISTASSSAQGAGSGMVLSSDGYVLTNYHVVQSSTRVRVEVASTRKTYTATVVGHDAGHDVALLKLQDASGLQTVRLDDDGDPAVGDTVTAVGNSEGQGYLSAAEGKVTDLEASITVSSETASNGSESLTDVLKTTAGALPGDSGGPMLDDEGEVVGITTAGEQASTGPRSQAVTVASYAVPIERALTIVEQIKAGDESGSVRIGPNAYLGVSVLSGQGRGLVVSSVVPDGPAAAAGITRGSTITGLDGTTITSQAALAGELAAKEPGESVEISWVDASGQSRSGTVRLGSSPVN